MAYAVFEDATTMDQAHGSGTTGIAADYPGTVDADDIIFLGLHTSYATTWDTPSGFGVVNDSYNNALYWKRASGSESGSVTCATNSAATQTMYATMYRVSGAITTGTPYEQLSGANGTGEPITIATLAGDTTGPTRLCLNFNIMSDPRSGDDDAASYAELDDQTSTYGFDGAMHLYSYAQASAGNPGADSYNLSYDSGTWHSFVLAVLPIPVAGYLNDVIGVASANISTVNGIATANIDKVIV